MVCVDSWRYITVPATLRRAHPSFFLCRVRFIVSDASPVRLTAQKGFFPSLYHKAISDRHPRKWGYPRPILAGTPALGSIREEVDGTDGPLDYFPKDHSQWLEHRAAFILTMKFASLR